MMKNIAKIIDHTNIRTNATAEDIEKTCEEAKKYGFRGVCINPEWVKLVKKELKSKKTKVVVLIDPPMGISSHETRFKKALAVKKDGADEIDIVMNIIDLKYERYDEILKDLSEITKILPTKVIIGSGYLTNDEIKKASQLVKKSGAFCVKTATEGDPLEHIELKEKTRHLKIMREFAPGLKIKVAGKIQTFQDLKMMIKAGADIIGTSSGVKIMEAFKRSKKRGLAKL